ncbi:hypothetical protein ACFX13_021737 [Malus domestica]
MAKTPSQTPPLPRSALEAETKTFPPPSFPPLQINTFSRYSIVDCTREREKEGYPVEATATVRNRLSGLCLDNISFKSSSAADPKYPVKTQKNARHLRLPHQPRLARLKNRVRKLNLWFQQVMLDEVEDPDDENEEHHHQEQDENRCTSPTGQDENTTLTPTVCYDSSLELLLDSSPKAVCYDSSTV